MSIASSYARALYDLVRKDASKSGVYIKNVHASLARRGIAKLAPAIAREYRKLEVADERRQEYGAVTPEKERVRVLLGLYKKLVETK